MTPLKPKYFCPACHSAFDINVQFCGVCGTDMHHASALKESSPTLLDRPKTQPTAAHTDPWLGRVIDNRYRVIEPIGHGGMGVVYRVEHIRMGRIAAMKVLLSELANDSGVLVRFRREANAVSMLHHPNTVQVFDFGTSNGAMYLIMEYVRGDDLATIIDNTNRIAPQRLLPLIGQICGSLSEAHALAVVHRDLKPENILVTRTHRGRDFVKVLDFGLAKIGERDEQADITSRGLIIGTPYYMSPEQIRGDAVDARSDIYSLGALMYCALTGQPPFIANTPVGVLSKHLTAPLQPPSTQVPPDLISPKVDALIARAMAKSVRDRHQSVSEFVDELEAAYADYLTESQRRSSMPQLSPKFGQSTSYTDHIDYDLSSDIRLRRTDLHTFERSMRRRRFLGIAIVPSILIGAACVIAYLFFIRPAQPQTTEQEPNNDIYEATLISTQQPVTGYLGKRLTNAEPDKDYYQLQEIPHSDGTTLVTIESTFLPNIDTELLLYNDKGQLLATADEGGVGQGEFIRNYRISTPIVVMISESIRKGSQFPTENVSDSYSISVHYTAPSKDAETEPNDTPDGANSIATHQTITGYLDRRTDIDTYRFSGSKGTYRLIVTGADKVPIRWKLPKQTPSQARDAKVTLHTNDLLQLSRGDSSLPPSRPLPGAGSPYTIQILSR